MSGRPVVKVYFEPRDWWIGYYRGDTHHYICPLPTVVIRWSRRQKSEDQENPMANHIDRRAREAAYQTYVKVADHLIASRDLTNAIADSVVAALNEGQCTPECSEMHTFVDGCALELSSLSEDGNWDEGRLCRCDICWEQSVTRGLTLTEPGLESGEPRWICRRCWVGGDTP